MSLNALSNLPKSQPVELKTAIILTDITKAGLSPAAADTFRFLLGQRIGAIVAIPSRNSINNLVSSAHHTLCAAVAATLQSSTADDLQKVSVASASSIGNAILPDVFSSGHVGDNIIFINDTFPNHPIATSLLAKWNGSVHEVQGFAFGESHSSVWPLTKKTVLIVTDANSEFEAQLSLQTVRDVVDNGASSVHVIVTSPAESNAAKIISGAFKVEIEAQPPVRADSPLWKRQVSVSSLSSSQGAASITAFSNAFVAAHAFVNDTSSEKTHDVIANIAFNNIRHQAAGLLRRTALVQGDLSGSSFKRQRDEEIVAKVWPVKTKRFAFLVDGSVIFNAASHEPVSAATIATFTGIARILKQGGNVLLIPSSASSSTSVSTKETQDAIARSIINLLTNNFGVTPSEVVTFTGEDFVPRHLGRTASIFLSFTNTTAIHENILKSCDVFVRDTTTTSKISSDAESLLAVARSSFTQIAVGNATSSLTNTENNNNNNNSILANSRSNVSIFTSIISSLTGSASGICANTSSSSSSSTASQDMRKPVPDGEGSLLSYVVASAATTILLHPLNLLITGAPNPNSLPLLPFLPLRLLHSVSRELIFHTLTKTSCCKSNKKPMMTGCLAAVVSGVASEPLRSIAYGGGGKQLASVPWNSINTSLLDPLTVISSTLVNLAPQSAFELAGVLQKLLVKYVPSSEKSLKNCKTQIVFALNAVARIIICSFLTRIVVSRNRYPVAGGILVNATAANPNARCNKSVMFLYMLREVLALVIETFVQKYVK